MIKLTIAAVLAMSSIAASATSLVDGSFETKGAATPVNDYCYDGFSAGGNAPCAASAWVGAGVIKTGSGAWGGTTTPAGNYFAFVQQNQTLSQSFTATSTGALALTWIDANRTNNGGAHSYAVSISDGVTTTALGTYTSGFGSFVARAATPFNGVAGTTYTLTFAGIFDGTDSTSFVDNVALSVVPEPGVWALLLSGFGLTGFAMRRTRRAAIAA